MEQYVVSGNLGDGRHEVKVGDYIPAGAATYRSARGGTGVERDGGHTPLVGRVTRVIPAGAGCSMRIAVVEPSFRTDFLDVVGVDGMAAYVPQGCPYRDLLEGVMWAYAPVSPANIRVAAMYGGILRCVIVAGTEDSGENAPELHWGW